MQQASVVGGCSLSNNMKLQYQIDFNDDQFDDTISMDTSYLLTNISQETDLEITITPSLFAPRSEYYEIDYCGGWAVSR